MLADWKPNEALIGEKAPYSRNTAQHRLWVALQRADPLIDHLRGAVAEAKQQVDVAEKRLSEAIDERDSLKAALEKLGPA